VICPPIVHPSGRLKVYLFTIFAAAKGTLSPSIINNKIREERIVALLTKPLSIFFYSASTIDEEESVIILLKILLFSINN